MTAAVVTGLVFCISMVPKEVVVVTTCEPLLRADGVLVRLSAEFERSGFQSRELRATELPCPAPLRARVQQLLAEAERLFERELRPDAAQLKLEEALSVFLRHQQLFDRPQLYAQVRFVHGWISFALGQLERADESFAAVASMASGWRPTRRVFPPPVVARYRQVATASAAQPSSMKLLSTPSGAAMTVDGRPACTAPCELSHLMRGTHFVTARLSGFVTEHRRVEVAGATVRVRIPLRQSVHSAVNHALDQADAEARQRVFELLPAASHVVVVAPAAPAGDGPEFEVRVLSRDSDVALTPQRFSLDSLATQSEALADRLWPAGASESRLTEPSSDSVVGAPTFHLGLAFGFVATRDRVSTPTPNAATSTEVGHWTVAGRLRLGGPNLLGRASARYAQQGITAGSQNTRLSWFALTADVGWLFLLHAGEPSIDLLVFTGYGLDRFHSQAQVPVQLTPSWLRHDARLGVQLATLGLDRRWNADLELIAIPGAALDEEYVTNGRAPKTVGVDASLWVGWSGAGVFASLGSLSVGLRTEVNGRWTSYSGSGSRRSIDGSRAVEDARQELLRLAATVELAWRWGIQGARPETE